MVAFYCLFARPEPENIWRTVETGDLSEDKFYGRLDQSPETEVLQILAASWDTLDTTKRAEVVESPGLAVGILRPSLLDFLVFIFLGAVVGINYGLPHARQGLCQLSHLIPSTQNFEVRSH